MQSLDIRSLLKQEQSNKTSILEELQSYKSRDLPWATGKVLAYVYEPEPEAKALIKEAYSLFLTENGLDPTSFPSVLRLENEVVRTVAQLLGGDEHTVGSFSSGGTESIILAVKTARDYHRAKKPEIKEPEMIIAHTAHAAFQKAAHYLGIKLVVLPVEMESYVLDPALVEEHINENTILLVASAPNYPFGVVDPVPELGQLALKHNVFLHVDACVGGMYLPFIKEADVPAFDFSVAGVTSISCDLHKYGYAAKGASTVLYRSADLRQYQIFSCSNWSGYSIVNPTVLSSKTAGPLAGAWAALRYFGQKGYEEMVGQCQAATRQCIEGIEAFPELEVLGNPVMNLVAIISTEPSLSVFDISDAMQKRGWYLQVQLASLVAPEAIHLSINKANVPFMSELLSDLRLCIDELKANPPSSPLKEMLDPAMLAGMMQSFEPSMLDSLEQVLGMDESGLPSDMAGINSILNGLSTEHRNILLKAFMNKMFR